MAIDGNFSLTVPAMLYNQDLLSARSYKLATGAMSAPKFSVSLLLDPDGVDFKNVLKLVAKIMDESNVDADPLVAYLPYQSYARFLKVREAKAKKSEKKFDPKFYDVLKGKVILNAGTAADKPPVLSVVDAGEIVDLTSLDVVRKHQGAFYRGVHALASVRFKYFEQDFARGNYGVTAYLQDVLSLNQGDRLAGSAEPGSVKYAKYLAAHVGQNSTVDPTEDF